MRSKTIRFDEYTRIRIVPTRRTVSTLYTRYVSVCVCIQKQREGGVGQALRGRWVPGASSRTVNRVFINPASTVFCVAERLLAEKKKRRELLFSVSPQLSQGHRALNKP